MYVCNKGIVNDFIADSDRDEDEGPAVPRSLMHYTVQSGQVAVAELLVCKGGVDLTANRARGPEQYQPNEFTFLGLAVHQKDICMYDIHFTYVYYVCMYCMYVLGMCVCMYVCNVCGMYADNLNISFHLHLYVCMYE
jgi:hypothetical protein